MIVLAINYLLISYLIFTIRKTTVWLHLLVFRLEFKVKFGDSIEADHKMAMITGQQHLDSFAV